MEDSKMGAVTGLMIPESKMNFVQKIQFFEYAVGFGLWNTVLSSIGGMSYIPGPLTIFRRRMFDEIGGFDPDNLTEDMEIGLRIQMARYKIQVCAYAVVETDVPDDWNKLARQRDRWYRGRVYNLFKYQEMIFNKSYGHLGMFSLPFLFLLELAGVFMFGRLLILVGQSLFNSARTLLWTVGTAHIVPPFELSFVLSTQMYFMIVAFAFVGLFFSLGLAVAGYRFNYRDIPAILVSLFLYPLFVTFTYIKSFLRELAGVKAIWQRVST
jgi:cellulose synthase/poly-beta-1,6-N-acetylglucosamine synthase-like glycosyltransferase